MFLSTKKAPELEKFRAMQTPSWFLHLLHRSSVFIGSKVRKYLRPTCFGACLLFLSSPFPVTFLPCFPWAPWEPLWLTTALKTNTVKSVPEEGGTPGVAAALGNFVPSWGGAGWGGSTGMRRNPMGWKCGNSPGLEWGQQHEEHLSLPASLIWGRDPCGSFPTQGIPLFSDLLNPREQQWWRTHKNHGTIPAEHPQCPQYSYKWLKIKYWQGQFWGKKNIHNHLASPGKKPTEWDFQNHVWPSPEKRVPTVLNQLCGAATKASSWWQTFSSLRFTAVQTD